MADPDADQDLTASPAQRRSSRPKLSSLSNGAREPSSTDPSSKRSKISDKASSAGFGGALGTVTENILDQDAYRLE